MRAKGLALSLMSRRRSMQASAVPADPTAASGQSLDDGDRDLLRRRWRSIMGRPAPPHLPRPLLLRILAYKEQIARSGELDPASLAALSAVPRSGEKIDGTSPPLLIRPGTVLVREFGGALHRVMALETGFAWDGETYSSLSAVASAITGTKWNGPRFFGLGDHAAKAKERRGGRVR